MTQRKEKNRNKKSDTRPDLLLFFLVSLNHHFCRNRFDTVTHKDDESDDCESRTQDSNCIAHVTRKSHQTFVDGSKENAANKTNQQPDGFESVFHFCCLICFGEIIITKCRRNIKLFYLSDLSTIKKSKLVLGFAFFMRRLKPLMSMMIPATIARAAPNTAMT